MPPSSAVTVIPRKRRGVELALIIFALLITISAYALVDYNVTGELSVNFPYVAGICTVLALAAHFAVRWRLPYADPVILPCVIVLNGLGLTMIHRIDLINDPPLNGARQQLIWTALGVILFIAIVVVSPRPQAAAAVHLHHRPVRHRAAAAAAGARTRHREVRGTDLDRGRRVQLPAGRGGQGAAVHRLRRLPGGEARGAGAGRIPDSRPGPAPRPRPGSDRGDLGAQPGHLGAAARPGHLAAVLRVVRDDALCRDRAPRLGGAGHPALCRRGVLRLSHLQPCPGPGRRLAGPVRRLRRLLPGDQCAVRDGVGRAARHRARAGPPGADPAGPQRLHRGGDR